MLALARIRVFVKIRPVEFGEGVDVFREMRRHPIHDDADAGLVTFIDEMAELVRGSEPAGGRVIIRDLITPGAFEGMLRDRKQFDVGVTHFEHVRDERVRQLEIAQRAVLLFRFAAP